MGLKDVYVGKVQKKLFSNKRNSLKKRKRNFFFYGQEKRNWRKLLSNECCIFCNSNIRVYNMYLFPSKLAQEKETRLAYECARSLLLLGTIF